MVIFKAFLQILNKNKGILFVYSLILVIFSVFSLKSNESTITFEATKPDIYIINHDLTSDNSPSMLSASLINYLAERSNLIELNSAEQTSIDGSSTDFAIKGHPSHSAEQLHENEALDDAIFYRHVNFALEIPVNFEADFLAGNNPAITFKSAGDYNASLAEMNLSRYLELANAYLLLDLDVSALAREVESTLALETPVALLSHLDSGALAREVESTLALETPVALLSHLDSGALARASYYYNFLNYPLLVGCIFMICLILLSFRDSKISHRLAMGAIPQAKINRILLGANLLFALTLWLVYVLLSFVIVGSQMFSGQGMLLILNSLVFTFCVVALAFLLANLIKSRNALNGIVNVIGLGSSFLCGVFVPLTWLPDSVRVIARALPSYWYVEANELITNLEVFSWGNLVPILGCSLIVLAFAITFVALTNFVSRHQRRLASKN